MAGGASKLVFGGETDWGTGATGTVIDGTGWDWVSQTVGRVNANLNSTAAAAAYHALSVTASQTSSNSCFGTWTELYFSNSVSLAASDNYASVWAQMEGGTSVAVPTTAGDFMAAVYANIVMGATFTTGASSVVNGVRFQSEISSTTISHAGRLSAFECLTKSGSYQAWDYGLYVAGASHAWYSATTQAGASALNNMELVTTDATTPSSGYSRTIYANHTNTGAKTGSAEVNVIAADFDASANVTTAYCFTGYVGACSGATINRVAGYAVYMDAITGTVGASSCAHLETVGGATVNDFISMRKHGGTIHAMISDRSGGDTATYFLHFNGANAPVAANTHSIDSHALQHVIAVQIGSDVGYIPVFDAAPA